MDIKRDKYDIEVRYDDAIKCNRIFFDFMQQTLNRLDGLKFTRKILFDRYNNRKSTEEVDCSGSWKTKQKNKDRNTNKEGTLTPSPKKSVLWIIQTGQIEQQVTLIIPPWIPPLTGFQWLVRYDLYFSHKPYGTYEPPFSSTKGYLPSITSISKLISIQQFNNSLLINLLTTILPMETP